MNVVETGVLLSIHWIVASLVIILAGGEHNVGMWVSSLYLAVYAAGVLCVRVDAIQVRVEGESLRIRKQDIILVGEITLEADPCCDDYLFALFVARRGLLAIPMEEARGALGEVERILGEPIVFGLANSCEAGSRVAWPSDLAGRSFLDLASLKAGHRVLDKWLDELRCG